MGTVGQKTDLTGGSNTGLVQWKKIKLHRHHATVHFGDYLRFTELRDHNEPEAEVFDNLYTLASYRPR